MNHPLTDKKAFKKFYDHTVDVNMDCLYTPDGIRAAADWQLKQVMKWLGKNLSNYTDDFPYHDDMRPLYRLEDDLKEAMRPTQTANKK
jgi:hypothetical protein